jgi:hypothetical protein
MAGEAAANWGSVAGIAGKEMGMVERVREDKSLTND